jgi:opacity protein-like surface antigen
MKTPYHRIACRPARIILAAFLGACAAQAEDLKFTDTQVKQIEEIVDKAVNPAKSSTKQALDRLEAQLKLEQPKTEKRINMFEEATYLSQQIFGTRWLGIPALINPKDNFNKQVMRSFTSVELESAGLMDERGRCNLSDQETFSPRLVLELLAHEMRVAPPGDDKVLISATNKVGNLELKASVTGKLGSRDLEGKNVTEAYKDYSTKDLTAAIHKELNNPNWLSDNTRFGSLMGYIDDGDAITAQIALRVYPSYHRHIPGRFLDLKNATRRLSLVVGIGPTLVQDTTDKQDIGMAYTAGIGFDLTHEVSLFGGYSYYTFTESESDKQETDTAFTVGLALNAELFQTFLKGTGN